MNKNVKMKSKEVIMEIEIIYLYLLADNSKKQIPLERFLAFENTPTPLSMFDNTGMLDMVQDGGPVWKGLPA